MALMICPECQGKVSSESQICVHCGYPIDKIKNCESDIQAPPEMLGRDLTIKGIGNIFRGLEFNAVYAKSINTDIHVNEGTALVLVGTNGMQINLNSYPLLTIHFLQIKKITINERSTEFHKKKSLIGRSIVGGVLLGGAGAIVGGMTGLGKKEVIYNYVLEISFYELKDQRYKTLNLLMENPKDGIKLTDIYKQYVKPKTISNRENVALQRQNREFESSKRNEKIDASWCVTPSSPEQMKVKEGVIIKPPVSQVQKIWQKVTFDGQLKKQGIIMLVILCLIFITFIESMII